MGSKDALTLIDNIRFNLGIPIATADRTNGGATNKFTQNQVLEALNKGKDRLWELIRSVQEDYFLTLENTSVTLATSDKTYTLPTSFRQLVAWKVTQSGYENVKLRAVEMSSDEFKRRDAEPVNTSDTSIGEILYAVVGTGIIRLADFVPVSLTTSMDFIAWLSDYTLSASSTTDLPDEFAEWMEAYATKKLLISSPKDERLPFWKSELDELTPAVLKSAAKRQIRDPLFVEMYDPS